MSAPLRTQKTRTWLHNRGKLLVGLVGAFACVTSAITSAISGTVPHSVPHSPHIPATMNTHVSAFRMQPLAGLDAKRAETVYLKWQAYGANHVRLFQTSQSDYWNYNNGYPFDTNCYPYWGAYLIKPDVDGGEVESAWVTFSGPSEKNYKSIGLHYCGDTYWYSYQKTTWGELENMVKEFNALQLAEKMPQWHAELSRLRRERRERRAR